MSLALKEVRVPTPSRRARKILGALSAVGPNVDVIAAGTIDPEVTGVALFYPDSAAMAVTLDPGTWVGQVIHLVMAEQDDETYTVVVTVAGPPAFAAPVATGAEVTATFSAPDHFLTAIWDGTNWAVRDKTVPDNLAEGVVLA